MYDHLRRTTLFDYISPAIQSSPEFGMFSSILNSVVIQGLSDSEYEQKEAGEYIQSEDCVIICDLLEVDHVEFTKVFNNIINKGK